MKPRQQRGSGADRNRRIDDLVRPPEPGDLVRPHPEPDEERILGRVAVAENGCRAGDAGKRVRRCLRARSTSGPGQPIPYSTSLAERTAKRGLNASTNVRTGPDFLCRTRRELRDPCRREPSGGGRVRMLQRRRVCLFRARPGRMVRSGRIPCGGRRPRPGGGRIRGCDTGSRGTLRARTIRAETRRCWLRRIRTVRSAPRRTGRSTRSASSAGPSRWRPRYRASKSASAS